MSKQSIYHILKILLLLAVFMMGVNLRLDDIKVWKERKNLYYLDNLPLFTSYDAYHFARYARDFLNGLYHSGELDPFRFVPDNFLEKKVSYPRRIPQISYIAAKGSSFLGIPIEIWSFYAVPIMACLFVFPLFFFLDRLGFTAAGLLGSLTGVISFIYLIRTSVARFDTDALNLFYPYTYIFFLFCYLTARKPFNYLSLLGAAVIGFLFNWWYGAGSPIIFAIILFFLLVYVLQYGLLNSYDKKDFILLILFLFSQLYFCWRAPLAILSYFKSLIEGKTVLDIFSAYPNVLESISELQKSQSIKQVSSYIISPEPLFVVGILGFVSLLIYERRYSFLLVPLFLIGMLVFKAGNRFGLYLAPYVGIGLGFLIHFALNYLYSRLELTSFLKKTLPLFLVVICGTFFITTNKNSLRYVATPKIKAPIAKNLVALKKVTPENAWVWTWWDYGYAIPYLGNRAVFLDGGSQTTPKTYYVALSFTTSSALEAYNTISFIATEGLVGIKKRLEKGYSPERLTSLIKKGVFVSGLKHPVYWLFTGDLFLKFGWISYFGSWDFKVGKGKRYFIMPLSYCRQRGDLINCANAKINLRSGIVQLKKKKIFLKKYILRTRNKVLKSLYPHRAGVIMVSVPSKYGKLMFLMDEASFQSNFVQMFILRVYNSNYFRIVFDDFPFAVLYEVKKRV